MAITKLAIEFTVFDHYGEPAFSKYETVYLHFKLSKGADPDFRMQRGALALLVRVLERTVSFRDNRMHPVELSLIRQDTLQPKKQENENK